MVTITLGTNYVLQDESCAGLYELNYQSPGNKGFHRYQIALVVREGDKIAEYRKDMGSAKKFKGVDQFRIPGGVVDKDTGKFEMLHTVGELMDIADKRRARPLFDKRELVGVDKINE